MLKSTLQLSASFFSEKGWTFQEESMKVKEKITDANMMHMYYELFKRFLSSLK